MSAAATRVLNEFETLSPEDQRLVRDEVNAMTRQRQLEALERLRGCSKGEGLLEKLLADRAQERAHG